MQINGNSTNQAALEQLSRSLQQINELNKAIVDSRQDMSHKLLKISVEAQVGKTTSDSIVDYTA